jgi:hypothetical protein
MFRKGAKYTSKSARTDIQFINRIMHDDRGRNLGIRRGMEKKAHEMFCKRIYGVPSTATNGACVRELGRTNRREKVVERIVKYWKRLWDTDETSLLREALKQQTIEKGENWLQKLEQEPNSLGMGDVWRRGGENNNNVWKVVSKRCTDTEHQKMEANIRGKKISSVM